MNIRSIGFVDTSFFTATLINAHRNKLNETGELVLRTPNEDLPLMKDWKSARALLTKIKNVAASLRGDQTVPKFGVVRVTRLDPGAFTAWHRDEDEYALSVVRLYCGLTAVPNAFLICGGMVSFLPVGDLLFVNHRQLHCDVNFGTYPRYALIADVKT